MFLGGPARSQKTVPHKEFKTKIAKKGPINNKNAHNSKGREMRRKRGLSGALFMVENVVFPFLIRSRSLKARPHFSENTFVF